MGRPDGRDTDPRGYTDLRRYRSTVQRHGEVLRGLVLGTEVVVPQDWYGAENGRDGHEPRVIHGNRKERYKVDGGEDRWRNWMTKEG